MTPGVSIVVPLLREPLDWLESCVRSALSQSAATDVLVVVSPLTPDELLVALRRWRADAPRLSVLVEEGSGFASALNTGIRASRTQRVGFLLADPGARFFWDLDLLVREADLPAVHDALRSLRYQRDELSGREEQLYARYHFAHTYSPAVDGPDIDVQVKRRA